jgi:polar amino acid transport system permease protein
MSGVAAGIGVLGVVQGAYATEVMRGAIQSVPAGQIEAARAFGMPPVRLARRITLPWRCWPLPCRAWRTCG